MKILSNIIKIIFWGGIIILWGFIIFQLLSGKVGKIEITIGILAVFLYFIIQNFEKRFDNIEKRITLAEDILKNDEQNERKN